MEFLYCLSFLLISILISKYFLHQRNNPLPLPILGHLHLMKKPLHRTLAKLSNRYGPVFFLNFGYTPVVVVSSPSAVEECLTKNDIAFANRPHLIVGEYLGYNYSTLVWASYGDQWRNLRRTVAQEVFSLSRLQLFSSVRTEEIRSLMLQIANGSDCVNFHKVEFKSMLFELMLNNLMRMIAGKRYYGENVEDLDEAKRFRDIVTEIFTLMGASNLSDFVPFMRWFDVQGLEKRMVKAHKQRDAFMQHLIDQRRETHFDSKDGEPTKTLIDTLLSQQQNDPKYYTDELIKGIISVLLTAGTDTSSATIEWAMSLLLNHPEALRKAQDEIDTHLPQARLHEESDIPKLPYLNNIISETLRLYPTGPVIIRRSAKDCTVQGFHVPTGSMVLMNLWGIHRDPNAWVEPMKFIPERFEMEKQKEGLNWIPFGSGRRRCPGESLATRMIAVTLGTLIQCFEWKRLGEERIYMTEGAGLTLPRAKPLVAMCKPRPTVMALLKQI